MSQSRFYTVIRMAVTHCCNAHWRICACVQLTLEADGKPLTCDHQEIVKRNPQTNANVTSQWWAPGTQTCWNRPRWHEWDYAQTPPNNLHLEPELQWIPATAKSWIHRPNSQAHTRTVMSLSKWHKQSTWTSTTNGQWKNSSIESRMMWGKVGLCTWSVTAWYPKL